MTDDQLQRLQEITEEIPAIEETVRDTTMRLWVARRMNNLADIWARAGQASNDAAECSLMEGQFGP
jgi:hypothetical protein